MFTVRLLITVAMVTASLSSQGQSCKFTRSLIVHPDGARQIVTTDERCQHHVETGLAEPNGNFTWHDVGQFGGANRTHTDVVKQFQGNGTVTNVTPSVRATQSNSTVSSRPTGSGGVETGPKDGTARGSGRIDKIQTEKPNRSNTNALPPDAPGGGGSSSCKGPTCRRVQAPAAASNAFAAIPGASGVQPAAAGIGVQ